MMPVRIDQKHLQQGHKQRQANSLGIHRDMEEQDHHDNGPQYGESYPNVTPKQQQDPRHNVKNGYKGKPAVLE